MPVSRTLRDSREKMSVLSLFLLPSHVLLPARQCQSWSPVNVLNRDIDRRPSRPSVTGMVVSTGETVQPKKLVPEFRRWVFRGKLFVKTPSAFSLLKRWKNKTNLYSCVYLTSSSAIAERPRCRVGQFLAKSGRRYSADNIGLSSTTVT